MNIWEQDLMPSRDVVLDFYAECEFTPEQQDLAQWEAIADHDLDEEVPGYLDISPYAQWRVVSGNKTCMIYQWYVGSGTNDDAYLYVSIERRKV